MFRLRNGCGDDRPIRGIRGRFVLELEPQASDLHRSQSDDEPSKPYSHGMPMRPRFFNSTRSRRLTFFPPIATIHRSMPATVVGNPCMRAGSGVSIPTLTLRPDVRLVVGFEIVDRISQRAVEFHVLEPVFS
jgi:hypothetical protein